jgi:isopenicillin N synthase-like dioxygenase
MNKNASPAEVAVLSNKVDERRALATVPLIDISPFCTDSDPAARKHVAVLIRQACVDIGFFYITGHGFSTKDLDSTLAWGRRFFELPLDMKLSIAAQNNKAHLGFIQTGGLNPDAASAANADRKERLYLSRRLAPGELEDEMSPAGKSQWLPEDVLPGFRAALEEQTQRKVRLARQLARAFSLSLDLPEDYLESYHDRLGCLHSFNYYPPMPPELADKLWGFSPHTDYGSFTILHQDSTGGLQAQNATGEWIDVPPISGTFVINVGDMLMRWTNDTYVSTLHRVMNLSTKARLSISFFVWPNPRAQIASLETCTASRPSLYEPVVSGEYIRQLLAQAYSTGKAGISARTAERLQK